MPNELYRDFIDRKADAIINGLGGTITPAPANAELYRDFLDRKFDDVINAIDNVKVKSFTYTGNGQLTRDVIFPTLPKVILAIQRAFSSSGYAKMLNNIWGWAGSSSIEFGSYGQFRAVLTSYDDNNKTLTLTGTTAGEAFNVNAVEYTVYYI